MSGARRDLRRRTRRSASCSGLLAAGDERVAVAPTATGSSASSRAATCSRALGAPTERRPSEPGPTLTAELARSSGCSRVFEAVAAVREPYEGVYLVGGTVRDILLGERSFDVDIAVEGDAIALAQRARRRARRPRARRTRSSAPRSSLYGDGERVDVVTARTEFYDAPAALPTVEHATIREDLFRRDFTINAMAVSLKGADFGRLVDPFGGRRDLEAETIRVLHNLSFIDDPTRIFRAIRYENRYGFRMDEHTRAARARDCIEMGLVGDLSSARLRDELEALLSEGEVEHSILRLAELGAATARSTRTSPPTTEAVAPARAPASSCATATGSRCPPGGSGSRRSRAGSRPTRSTTGCSA